MMVVKLGGSLLDKPILKQWLLVAAEHGKGKLVIVAGGGVFADQVRLQQQQWQYNEQTAHRMALLAMQQMALLFNGLCDELEIVSQIAAISAQLESAKVLVWSPSLTELDVAEIPETWEVTSDSLAVYLAAQLNAEQLILVKSAQLPSPINLYQLSEQGIVDQAFLRFVQQYPIPVDCLSSEQLSSFEHCLRHYDS